MSVETPSQLPTKWDRSYGAELAKTWAKANPTLQYTLYGALFGFAFPVFSTLLDLLVRRLPLTLGNILQVQASTPLHWVIDTAPLFLGLVASLAGMRQYRLERRSQERDQILHQLEDLQAGLEQRVVERTRVLELATGIGRSLSTVRDLDTLLGQGVELIRSSYNLYHVQIYLTDPAGRNLVLRAGTGEAGAEMIRRGDVIPIGPGSINGTAAATKQAIIVSDITQSAVFEPDPLLPDTCSEIAVPLVVGERAVGVLNLQHDQLGFLAHENLPVFEALAGQFAIAVDNARLFSDAAQARAVVEDQLNHLAYTGWQDYWDGIQRSERIGYTYAGDALEPVTEPLVATDAQYVLTAPIQVQETPIGVIQIEGEADRTWTKAEAELVTSVAHQVAQHVENLRLLAQTNQYRASAEQASRRLTREGWQAYLASKAEAPSAGFVYDRYEVKPLTSETPITAETHGPALIRPLQVRGETIGQLVLGEVEVLDDEAIELMDATAQRLSAHIESLRLFEETRSREYELEERSQELEASQRVTFAAAEITDPDTLLDLVVNLIRDQFDLYHVQVYLVDKTRNAAVLRKSTGYAGQQLLERGHQISLGRSALVTRAINSGKSVVVNDVKTDENWLPNPLLPNTQSELVLPLQTGDSVIGALDVQARTPNRFTPALTALFQAMAEQVAMTFAKTELLARTQQQAEVLMQLTSQLQTASDVAERVSAILDSGELLREDVTLMQQRFGLYHAHVYLLDGETLKLRAGSGEIGEILLERGHAIPLDREHSLVAQSARSRQIITVNDTALEDRYMSNPLLPQTRSEMAVPLIASGQVLGVLDVQDNEPDRFGPTDQDTFATLAGHIATALDNANLFAERKRAEEEIRETAEQLREMDRLKSEFLANMSHELRTPLNSIIGYVQLLLMDLEGEIPEESYEDMKSVETNSKHLLNLINDVLDLARIEAGRMELHMENMDVASLLDIVRHNNAGLFIDSDLTFTVETQPDLPKIYADPIRITQVLNNLISNAFKFTETGGITVRAYRKDSGVCIAVEDTGIGIAEKDLTTIFERFRQVDGSFSRRAEGTGLGLSITSRLVEMHGGRVTVNSKLGQGSTFTIYLPVATPSS